MNRTKYLSAFERGMEGARRTGLSMYATLLGFSTQFPVYQERSTTQSSSSQLWEALESTWASVAVERMTPSRCTDKLRPFEGKTQY